MKKSIAKFFDKYAVDFDLIYGEKNNFLINFINNRFRQSMRIRFVKTIEGCHPISGKRIVDIGCGGGRYAIALAKNGAEYAYGIDFAKGMIDLAKRSAEQRGMSSKCKFEMLNFITDHITDVFDYAILMGLMDYIKDPRAVIKKALSITKSKAFFSFPAKGGVLAWQRKLRYMIRCNLFFYDEARIRSLFKGLEYKELVIEKIGRDFFVIASL